MKNLLLSLILLSCLNSVKCQLSGNASLQGQTNHAGIRVKFTAQGGTAMTDSSYTNSTGNYSINITPGVYSITFAKPGYVDAFYSNGASVLLTNTTVLSGITLDPGNPVFVSGAVSGTWSSNNVYVVLGNLTVPSGSILSIQAGTKIQFNGYFSINGNGIIKAYGGSNNPILFTSGRQGKARNDWNQIGLNSAGSSFDNCIFEYASTPLVFQSGSANVTNSILRHGGTGGIYMAAGSPLIENNEVYDLDDQSASIGIWVEGSATGTISCNFIHDIHSGTWNSYGIIHNSSLVKDNRINTITGPSPIGIQTRRAGSRNINNYISNSGAAIDIDGSFAASNPLIANNTLYANQIGIHINCSGYPTNPIIVNNLITGNANGIAQGGANCGAFTVDHNLLWNQSVADYTNVQIVGLGQIITTNPAGYPVDSYFNMSQDPLYSGVAPLLSTSSPCYGTGNTAYSGQIGAVNPQGCMATILSIKESNRITKLNVFPNPSSGAFTLSADSGDEMVITIFDMDGRLVHTSTTKPGKQIHAEYLTDGIYILAVKKGAVSGTTLLSISK